MFSKKSFSTPTIIVDGDLYLYRACAAAEVEIDWGDDIWSLQTDLKVAREHFQRMLDGFSAELSSQDTIVAFSGSDVFRMHVAPTYKGGRKKTRKPVGYKAMLEWAKETFETIQVDCLEADDVLGILGSVSGSKAIVVSDDKDLKSVPCRLYRPISGEKHSITLEEADRNFLTQTLTGDATDGYAGCPKVGPKTAEKILGSHPTWDTVVKAYQKEKLSFDDALTQARLARILRESDWDEENQKVKLWEPTR